VISVVIVNHNGGATLGRCLASLEKTPGGSPEIVMVDNASTDGSVEATRRRFPWLRVEALATNIGFAAANNIGAALTRGDRLLLLNPDAWLVGDCLVRLEASLAADPRLGLVAPRLVSPDGRPQLGWSPDRGIVGEMLQKVLNRLENHRFMHGRALRVVKRLTGPGWFTAACVLIRRQAFEDVEGFDERFFLYFEDTDLNLRLRSAGWRLAAVDDAVVCHERGPGAEDPRVHFAYRTSQLYYYRKHRRRWEQHVIECYLALKLGDEWPRVRAAADGLGSIDSEAT